MTNAIKIKNIPNSDFFLLLILEFGLTGPSGSFFLFFSPFLKLSTLFVGVGFSLMEQSGIFLVLFNV